jgi:site-specific recombinase XerD
MLSLSAASMARVNILKRTKVDGRWKMVSIPRRNNDSYDWKSLPDGRYLIE